MITYQADIYVKAEGEHGSVYIDSEVCWSIEEKNSMIDKFKNLYRGDGYFIVVQEQVVTKEIIQI